MNKFLLSLVALIFIIAGCGAQQSPGESAEEPEAKTEEAAKEEKDVLKVAAIPAQSTGEVEDGFKKLEAELAEKLNREVALEVYPNYNAVVEAINYGHVDLAFLGPVTYLVAHQQSGAKAILTLLDNGEPFYYSYIIAHVDSPWENLEQLLEERGDVDFAFGSISSTSGSIIPSYELLQRGVFQSEEDHEFKSVVYTGSHDITAQQVQSKLVHAGAIDSAIYHKLIKDGTIDESQFKILWQSEQLYQYPWVVPGDTDEETIKQIQEAFLSITDEEILSALNGASGFVEADPSKYENVLNAIKEVRPEMLEN